MSEYSSILEVMASVETMLNPGSQTVWNAIMANPATISAQPCSNAFQLGVKRFRYLAEVEEPDIVILEKSEIYPADHKRAYATVVPIADLTDERIQKDIIERPKQIFFLEKKDVLRILNSIQFHQSSKKIQSPGLREFISLHGPDLLSPKMEDVFLLFNRIKGGLFDLPKSGSSDGAKEYRKQYPNTSLSDEALTLLFTILRSMNRGKRS